MVDPTKRLRAGRDLDAAVLGFLERLRALPERVGLITSLVLVAVVGIVDYVADFATRDELTLVLFYLPAIALAAWTCRARWAFSVTAIAAAVGLLAARATPEGASIDIDVANAISLGIFFAVFASASILLRRLVDDLSHRAATDDLTGLMTRTAFYEHVEVDRRRAERTGRPITVLYLDLDNLKATNDEFGHEAGDGLLAGFAGRLAEVVRPTDWIARFGGDEFAVALVDTDEVAAAAVLQRLRAMLADPVTGGLVPSVSIGSATFREVPDSVDEMLRAADQLMFEAKHDHRGSVRAAVRQKAS
jgi:diguanylate cyclase (GGDEF)-like protein